MTKKHTYILYLLSLLLFGKNLHSQNAKLSIDVNVEYNESPYSFYLFSEEKDTTIPAFRFDFYDSELYVKDSLIPGKYIVKILNSAIQAEPIFIKHIILKPNLLSELSIYLEAEKTETEMDTSSHEKLESDRSEFQFSGSYTNGNWLIPTSVFKHNYSLELTTYYWGAGPKHTGVLFGVGLGSSQNFINKDTSFQVKYSEAKISERYSYWYAKLDLKLRFSSAIQQHSHNTSKFTFDLGVLYNFPISLQHVTNYPNANTVRNKYIHQYTDFRTYVNFGYAPVVLFFEYKLSNFIIANYPELPKYNMGIKILIHTD